jgi:hypothetical protein
MEVAFSLRPAALQSQPAKRCQSKKSPTLPALNVVGHVSSFSFPVDSGLLESG